MAKSIQFKNGGWKECDCGGTPGRVIAINPSDAQVIFTSQVYMELKGKSGAAYKVIPRQVALDVLKDDAAAFIASGQAQALVPGAESGKYGYLSRAAI